jgi:hypothetical protein
VAPIFLGCPACNEQISSSYSAHSCPHCGEALSEEWEERGRKELKRRRIGLGFVLASISFVIAAVIIEFNNEAGQRMGTLSVASTTQPPTKPKESERRARAFGFKPDLIGGRGLFIDVRAKNVFYAGKQVQVLCPADGTGEIIALVDGTYVAVNMASRGWARSTGFWAVEGDRLLAVVDSGVPDHVPQQFGVLENHLNAIIEIGARMCPLAPSAGEGAWKSLSFAVQNYEANARRLGVSIP